MGLDLPRLAARNSRPVAPADGRRRHPIRGIRQRDQADLRLPVADDGALDDLTPVRHDRTGRVRGCRRNARRTESTAELVAWIERGEHILAGYIALIQRHGESRMLV